MNLSPLLAIRDELLKDIEHLRAELVRVNRKLKAVDTAIDELKDDTISLAPPEKEETPSPIQIIKVGKGKFRQKVSEHEFQTALVKFSIEKNAWFTTDEALNFFLHQGIIKRKTSSIRNLARKFLADSTFFMRDGMRHLTKWRAAS